MADSLNPIQSPNGHKRRSTPLSERFPHAWLPDDNGYLVFRIARARYGIVTGNIRALRTAQADTILRGMEDG